MRIVKRFMVATAVAWVIPLAIVLFPVIVGLLLARHMFFWAGARRTSVRTSRRPTAESRPVIGVRARYADASSEDACMRPAAA